MSYFVAENEPYRKRLCSDHLCNLILLSSALDRVLAARDEGALVGPARAGVLGVLIAAGRVLAGRSCRVGERGRREVTNHLVAFGWVVAALIDGACGKPGQPRDKRCGKGGLYERKEENVFQRVQRVAKDCDAENNKVGYRVQTL